MMNAADRERYSRQILFGGIGERGQEALRSAHAAVAGCGALGSFHAAALARAGVGTITIIDRDYVEPSNLQRQWLFEEADAGTLFLDEIGELPTNLQVKLLRVLQDETIRRLGDTKDVKVDVRIVAATHRDLTADTKAGRFRDDLFYRINVLSIVVPPLRSRREDVNLLIDHFIARNNTRLGTNIRGVSTEGRKLLLEYGWPGNVRELENTIERAMVLAEADVLQVADLPERIREALDPVQVQLATGEFSVKKTTAAIEQILIRRALQKTKGNRTRAADLLEISHRALLYKIKDYKITDL